MWLYKSLSPLIRRGISGFKEIDLVMLNKSWSLKFDGKGKNKLSTLILELNYSQSLNIISDTLDNFHSVFTVLRMGSILQLGIC